MATVPRIQGFGVSQEAAPNFRQQNPVSADVLSIPSRQAEQFGQSLVGAGGAIMAKEKEAFDQANALRVDDALNRATEQAMRLQHDKTEGFTSLKGFDAVNRESGLPLAAEFTEKLDKGISDIAGTLGNDRQRQMFQMHANDLRTRFLTQATAYEGAQYREYNLSTREATVPNAANALILNFSDPKNVEQQVTRIRGAIMGGVDPNTGVFVPGSAQMQGKSAAWAQQKADEAVSGAHLGAIQTAMEAGNVNAAMRYRQKYADQLTAADMIKIDGTLQRNYDTMQGARVASQVVQGTAAQVNPTDMDRLTNVIMGVESGGRDTNAQGGILTSPKGAQGRMQVMPATNKDPGFGVRPAADDGPEERARVGRDYLAAMVKRYDGNIAKAAAAYNAGPGAVDKALKDAQANAGKGEPVPQDAWVASLPAETRAYVANVTKRMQSPEAGVPTRPTLESLHQQARATLGPNASPLAVKTAIDGITQQYADQEKAIEQRKNETLIQAQQELVANGGVWANVSPKVRDAVIRFAPGEVDNMMKFGDTLAKGQDVNTDWNLYTNLRAMAASNPKAFNSTDLRLYYSKLAPKDRESLIDMQMQMKNPAKIGEVASLEAQLGNAHDSLNLRNDPTRKGKFDSVVTAQLAAEQAQKGKPLTYEERQKVIDRNMLTTDAGGWFSTKKAYEVAGTPEGIKAKAVPTSDDTRMIQLALKAEGISNPTAAQIQQRFNLKYGIR